MILLYGADTAEKIKDEISGMLSELKGYIPTLGIVRIGSNPADISYEKGAVKKMESLSLKTKVFEFDENISSDDFIDEFKKINEDDEIDGILLFRPLPKHIDEKKVIEVLDERKDLDGISYKNIAKVFAGDESGFAPCTARAVIKILESNNIELEGKNVVVLGRSMVIGKPVAMLAIQKNATVTLCHSKTADLKKMCKNADILIVAIGRAKMINDDYIGEDAVVIDVGINFFEGKLCGDVDLENVKNAAMATPVPKGVGAVTTSVLAEHLVIAALKKRLY
ncbi:bifunctional 5,10-methylenetetrahydrofolate dehydrogenase/5,10-methenyltetrahydrofolate cyclohydrolase [Lachnoanaerobaculum sp. JCM 36186]|uniref:bifunctional 5,10-methylenetetrahydrofolate dehydrogenase/5,10-methenyltetrahydrofolate cyclohydrolase n=1 Tax=Lachnoanaerobaculum sanguinis TaxID=3065809 RepID=UPI00276A2468|nr:bifunctional 5,10-methylenetetrahydrofolate dehydrogenase/5,10-methenyltetrahydrofolate cyclohydrolase [Lachnoanaerobaculum sp. JCM 36186]GMO03375.1 bifunctional 5,10-methylenetetrahydrofolate dehydrogenase/5,10-methenyltetrahydrofolate cyclohydrolase [Lachnoanaerobaculum sp. JCM 36186]